MSDASAKIAELTARISVLEAAVRTGNASGASVKVDASDYPFLAKLTGDDLIAAQALIQENAALKEKVEGLTTTVEQRDYRILHLKRSLEKLIPSA
ncbi:hypothetical protein TRFO_11407 [Tritrichomonas foetus]|uniref:Uncharacterized protein n=1 Tax=Tritrichomonas foetus TaxID=1144522 RepID=A0A1J4J7E2_9EUKA|nr:hypothetical protein TRFO_11407 [Tritrichomonas foetus]|eukprot:OHS94119.1 hypothetical protein TRFO_11407 [Tritrichomonas foetus]